MATTTETTHAAEGTQAPGGAHEGGGFPPFDSAHFSSSLIWLAITFGALYYLMSKIALPRMEGILADRRAKIDADLNAAKAAKAKADAAAAAHAKTLSDARANSQLLAQQTRDKLAAATEAKRQALEAELNAKLASAEAQIAATKAQAMTNVAGIAHDAAHAIIEHITGVKADSAAIHAAIAAQR